MNDKEKLIELLTRELRAGAYFNRPRIAGFADYLIANGVIIQKQGEWVKHGYKWMCSNCKSKINLDGTPTENNLIYCSHCGAKMKEA